MVFREGDSPLRVKWFFADENAAAFPGWHSFGSANWVNRECEAGAIGEQPGTRTWRNGSKPTNGGTGNLFAVQCASQVNPSWWITGIPAGEESGPYETNGLPTCCVDGPPVEQPCTDCSAAPAADMSVSFTCPGCPDLDGTSWLLAWDGGLGNWTINGQQFLPSCAPPNFGAITVTPVPATSPCELQFDGAQLFCFAMGVITAEAVCDGDGNFLFCEWSGSFTGAPDGCDAVPFTARLEVF